MVKVAFAIEYVVPADEEAIREAKAAIMEDLATARRERELHTYFQVSPAPGASWDDVPLFLVNDEERKGPRYRTLGRVPDDIVWTVSLDDAIAALRQAGPVVQQHNLLSTASDQERRDTIARHIAWWNDVALPVLEAYEAMTAEEAGD